MNLGYILNGEQIRSSLLNRDVYKSTIDSLNTETSNAINYLGKESEIEKNRAYNEYADTIEQAYISAQQNKNFVDASTMFRGYKDKIDYDIDSELDKIYSQASEAYQKNIDNIAEKYLSNVNEVSKNYNSVMSGISESVDNQYNMINRYWQDHLKYYDEYLRGNLIKPFTAYGSYIDSWFDEEGNMKSVDNLLAGMTDEQQIKFLKMLEDVDTDEMLKTLIGEDYISFSDWLRENDEKAYEWALSTNDLDTYGAETFNKVFGKTSDKFSSIYSIRDEYKKLNTAEERYEFMLNYVKRNYEKSDEEIAKELYGDEYTDNQLKNIENAKKRIKLDEINEEQRKKEEEREKQIKKKAPLGTFSK